MKSSKKDMVSECMDNMAVHSCFLKEFKKLYKLDSEEASADSSSEHQERSGEFNFDPACTVSRVNRTQCIPRTPASRRARWSVGARSSGLQHTSSITRIVMHAGGYFGRGGLGVRRASSSMQMYSACMCFHIN